MWKRAGIGLQYLRQQGPCNEVSQEDSYALRVQINHTRIYTHPYTCVHRTIGATCLCRHLLSGICMHKRHAGTAGASSAEARPVHAVAAVQEVLQALQLRRSDLQIGRATR
jgi:hypothetical protein